MACKTVSLSFAGLGHCTVAGGAALGGALQALSISDASSAVSSSWSPRSIEFVGCMGDVVRMASFLGACFFGLAGGLDRSLLDLDEDDEEEG